MLQIKPFYFVGARLGSLSRSYVRSRYFGSSLPSMHKSEDVFYVCSIKTDIPTILRDLDLESPKGISNVEHLKIPLFLGL